MGEYIEHHTNSYKEKIQFITGALKKLFKPQSKHFKEDLNQIYSSKGIIQTIKELDICVNWYYAVYECTEDKNTCCDCESFAIYDFSTPLLYFFIMELHP